MSDLVMYFVVNKDLKMGKGKIASQVAHGCMDATLASLQNKTFLAYANSQFHRKIVLKVDQKGFEKAKKIPLKKWIVTDTGLTQVDPDTETVIAFEPTKDYSLFKDYKLM